MLVTRRDYLKGSFEKIHFARYSMNSKSELFGSQPESQNMQALGAVAGSVAHDFNNILTCILGHAEMSMQQLDPTHPAYVGLAEIVAAGSRARGLVSQILAFGGKHPIEKRTIELGWTIVETLRLVAGGAPKNVALRTELPKKDLKILADLNLLIQVILNLSTNAFHAIGDAPGELTVSLEEASAADYRRLGHPTNARYARITVADTGSGMTKKTLSRIFEPYFTTKAAGQGTGLGLSIVDAIVRSHGGFLDVDSRRGKGTRFHVFLPLVDVQASALGAQRPRLLRDVEGRRKILVVDDDHDVAALAAAVLRSSGYNVTATTDPRQAVRLLRRQNAGFDLVLTDLWMPNLSGPELAKIVKKINPGLPIVLVTGVPAGAAEQKASPEDFVRVVTKPFDVARLQDAIQDVLSEREPALLAS